MRGNRSESAYYVVLYITYTRTKVLLAIMIPTSSDWQLVIMSMSQWTDESLAAQCISLGSKKPAIPRLDDLALIRTGGPEITSCQVIRAAPLYYQVI